MPVTQKVVKCQTLLSADHEVAAFITGYLGFEKEYITRTTLELGGNAS